MFPIHQRLFKMSSQLGNISAGMNNALEATMGTL